jgi:hypothetical protein
MIDVEALFAPPLPFYFHFAELISLLSTNDFDCRNIASYTMMSDTAINGPVKTHLKSPSPPRWRFVNEAKKSYGYSSASAGHVVHGFTSEELAAKYNHLPEELDAQTPKKIDTANNLEFVHVQRKYNDVVEVEHDAISSSEMGVSEIATQPTETSEDANPEDVFIDVPLNDDVPESDEVVVAVPKDPITGYSKKRGILLLVVILVAAIAVGISFRKKGNDTESTELSFSEGLFMANKTSSPSEALSLASLLPSNSPSEFQLLSNNVSSSSVTTPSSPSGSSSTPSTFPTYEFRTDNPATPSLEPSATLTTEVRTCRLTYHVVIISSFHILSASLLSVTIQQSDRI